MTTWFELSEEDDRSIAAFMSEVAALPTSTMRDPKPLWWKAQLVRRWDAERRAQAPLELMERVEIVAGLAAAAVLIFWVLPTVGRIVAGPLFGLLG